MKNRKISNKIKKHSFKLNNYQLEYLNATNINAIMNWSVYNYLAIFLRCSSLNITKKFKGGGFLFVLML